MHPARACPRPCPLPCPQEGEKQYKAAKAAQGPLDETHRLGYGAGKEEVRDTKGAGAVLRYCTRALAHMHTHIAGDLVAGTWLGSHQR